MVATFSGFATHCFSWIAMQSYSHF